VNPEEIKRVLLDQEEDLKRALEKKIVPREVADSVNASLVAPNAFLVTGVRRCGKSTLAVQVAGRHRYARVNFDDERLSSLGAGDLNNVLEAVYTLKGDVDVLVFDEIQAVGGWEMFVSRLRDTKKVLVTGSNSSLLSREFGTRLTGRHIDFTLFPFSFREFIAYRGFAPTETTKGVSQTKRLLEEYMSVGGFPEAQMFGRAMLRTVLDDVILKDVVLRHGIRNERLIFEIARFLFDNPAREISYNRVKEAFNVPSVHTIADYVRFLEDTFLVSTVERFSAKTLSRYTLPRKVYSVDPGLAGKDVGHVMENLVYLELRRRGVRPTYYADPKFEVDFVTPDELIQVTYANDQRGIERREVRSLAEVGRKIGQRKLKIITYDAEGEVIEGGRRIRLVPLWKYLLRAAEG
jgi:predicted AAA+ superfamily ATPase